ncbi:MAG: hypothetical protein ABIF77_01270 [bacterium]
MDSESIIHWLVTLAGFEKKLEVARSRVERATRKRRDLQELMQEYEEDLADVKQDEEGSVRQVRELEREIQELESRLKYLREQRDQVRDNKTYQALNGEIKELSQRIDTLETRVLEQIESLDNQGRKVTAQQAELAAKRDEIVVQRQQLQAEAKDAEALQPDLVREIAACEEHLPQSILAVLNHLRPGLSLPVVYLEGEACGGCHAQFPTQVAIGIDQGRSVVRCQACGRYVVPSP